MRPRLNTFAVCLVSAFIQIGLPLRPLGRHAQLRLHPVALPLHLIPCFSYLAANLSHHLAGWQSWPPTSLLRWTHCCPHQMPGQRLSVTAVQAAQPLPVIAGHARCSDGEGDGGVIGAGAGVGGSGGVGAEQPTKSTRELVRLVRSTKTDAWANCRLYVDVPATRS